MGRRKIQPIDPTLARLQGLLAAVKAFEGYAVETIARIQNERYRELHPPEAATGTEVYVRGLDDGSEEERV